MNGIIEEEEMEEEGSDIEEEVEENEWRTLNLEILIIFIQTNYEYTFLNKSIPTHNRNIFE